MTMGRVEIFVESLSDHFSRRFDTEADEIRWLRSMVDLLKPYSASVLDLTAKDILATRTERSFPLIAEIKKVADKHATAEAREKNERPLTDRHKWSADPYSDGRYDLADDLVKASPIGREAALQGWILGLHDFCRENGRLPRDSEISKIKEDSRGFDEAYKTCVRGEGGELNNALLRLGDSMLARREKYRVMVLGGDA